MVYWPQTEPVCLDWTTLWVQMMPQYSSYWSGECITCLLVEGVMTLLPSSGRRALAAFSSVLCCQRQGPWLLPLEAVLPCPAGHKTGGRRRGRRAQTMQILYSSLSQSLAGLRGKQAPDTEVLSIFVSPAAQVGRSDALTAIASVS